MEYINIYFEAPEFLSEILQAELASEGLDFFLETDTGFEVSVPKNAFDESLFAGLCEKYADLGAVSFRTEESSKENWNAEWENSYEPVRVPPLFIIRHPRHPKEEGFAYDLIIRPQMSFGTGHHETTEQMAEALCGLDLAGKSVLDLGCGTGILTVLACLKNAASVTACDIDTWAVENTLENLAYNACTADVFEGTAQNTPQGVVYDVVLANINLNVLLAEMPRYAQITAPGGLIFFSGFYASDLPQLRQKAAEFGIEIKNFTEKNGWACGKANFVNC